MIPVGATSRSRSNRTGTLPNEADRNEDVAPTRQGTVILVGASFACDKRVSPNLQSEISRTVSFKVRVKR